MNIHIIVAGLADVSRRTISEALVSNFFAAYGVRCKPVPTRSDQRTPDFIIELAQPVVCEVKQIEPNKEDLAAFANPFTLGQLGSSEPHAKGQWVRNNADWKNAGEPKPIVDAVREALALLNAQFAMNAEVAERRAQAARRRRR